MDIDMRTWYLDFCENGQQWHIDLERKPENPSWVNIGYGYKRVLSHFCNFVDVMVHEFGTKFTTSQINRLAECIPGLTVFRPTSVPDEEFDAEVHMRPIYSKEMIEERIEWKSAKE